MPETFRLRASNYSLLTLRLLTGRIEEVLPALGDQFQKAPGFLRFAPIAIGLDDLGDDRVDFPALIQGLRALEILPIGVTGGTQMQRAAAAGAGLPTLRPTGQKETEVQAPAPVAAPPVAMAPPVAEPPPAAAAARPSWWTRTSARDSASTPRGPTSSSSAPSTPAPR